MAIIFKGKERAWNAKAWIVLVDLVGFLRRALAMAYAEISRRAGALAPAFQLTLRPKYYPAVSSLLAGGQPYWAELARSPFRRVAEILGVDGGRRRTGKVLSVRNVATLVGSQTSHQWNFLDRASWRALARFGR